MADQLSKAADKATSFKLQDLTSYARNLTKDPPKLSTIQPQVLQGIQKYKAQYIDTGKITPMFHVMWGVFFVFYAIGLPGERRHMKREQEALASGKKGHH